MAPPRAPPSDGPLHVRCSWMRLVRATGRTAFRVAFMLGTVVTAAREPASAQSTLSLARATCPLCSAERAAAAKARQRLSLGVAARDVLGHEIGTLTAGDKWHPLSEEKQTVCGELHQFKWYYDGDEDWAFNIIPDGPYKEMLDAALNAGGEAVCGGRCVHAEINMDGHFPKDDFFKLAYHMPETHVMDAPDVLGKRMCVYGPWVEDIAEGHGDKPEIHPAEAVWWLERDPTALQRSIALSVWGVSTNIYHIMLLQDDRNSFDRETDYNGPVACVELPFVGLVCGVLPGGPRPWSKVPRRAEVRVEFSTEVDGGKPFHYAITERFSRHVTTAGDATARLDQGSGTDHSINMDGVELLQVRELQPDDHLGVLFDSVCLIPESSVFEWIRAEGRFRRIVTPARVIGQIVLNSQFGVNDRGKEGFQVLDIVRAEIDLSTQLRRERLLALSLTATQVLNDTIRAIVAGFPHVKIPLVRPPKWIVVRPRNVAGELVGDIVMTEHDSSSPLPVRADVYRTRSTSPVAVAALATGDVAAGREDVALIRSIPVMGVDSVMLRFGDGTSMRASTPKLGLTSSRQERVTSPVPAPTAWPWIAAAVGRRRSPGRAPGDVYLARHWSIEIVPRYAVRDEEGVPEEDDPYARALNLAVTTAARGRDASSLLSLFGTASPFTVSWTFVGTNVTTGKRVAVRIGQPASAGEIAVQLVPRGPIVGYDVAFPASDAALFRLDAVGKLRDTLGTTGEVRNTTWSHYVSFVEQDASIEAAIVALAGSDSSEWIRNRGLRSTIHLDPKMARLYAYWRQLMASTRRATSDGRVTPGELGQLVSLIGRERKQTNDTTRPRR